MRTSEVLNKAADHIEQYGHMVGRAHGDGTLRTAPACMIGAIGVATIDGTSDYAPAVDSLRSYLPWPATIPDWSDSHTAAEVVEALRACAVIEAAREEQETAEATYAANLAVTA